MISAFLILYLIGCQGMAVLSPDSCLMRGRLVRVKGRGALGGADAEGALEADQPGPAMMAGGQGSWGAGGAGGGRGGWRWPARAASWPWPLPLSYARAGIADR